MQLYKKISFYCHSIKILIFSSSKLNYHFSVCYVTYLIQIKVLFVSLLHFSLCDSLSDTVVSKKNPHVRRLSLYCTGFILNLFSPATFVIDRLLHGVFHCTAFVHLLCVSLDHSFHFLFIGEFFYNKNGDILTFILTYSYYPFPNRCYPHLLTGLTITAAICSPILDFFTSHPSLSFIWCSHFVVASPRLFVGLLAFFAALSPFLVALSLPLPCFVAPFLFFVALSPSFVAPFPCFLLICHLLSLLLLPFSLLCCLPAFLGPPPFSAFIDLPP